MGIQLDRVINENYEKLNTVDQHILQFVQANLESCKKMNIADLARHCSVSTATILRTAQKLNFSGYSEFKYFLRSDSAENAEVLNLIEILNQDISQTTKLFLQNSQVLDICRLIEQSSRIYAYGTGDKSGVGLHSHPPKQSLPYSRGYSSGISILPVPYP